MNDQFTNNDEFFMSTDDAYNTINSDINTNLLTNLNNGFISSNSNENVSYNMNYNILNSVSNDDMDNNYNNTNMNVIEPINNNLNGAYFGQMFSQNQYNSNLTRGIYNIEEDEEEEDLNNRNMQVQIFNQNEIVLNQHSSLEQKLQLAERTNEIYRNQLKYMQNCLASVRTVLSEKEKVIQNLMLRLDIGLLKIDPTRRDDLNIDEVDQEELRKRAENLAQRTILENFELRKLVCDSRDENSQILGTLFELQDKANLYSLTISKLENQITKYESNNIDEFDVIPIDENYNTNNDGINYNHNPNNSANSVNEKTMGQSRRASKEFQLQIPSKQNLANVEDMMDPANTEEAKKIRSERETKHNKQTSFPTPDLYSSNNEENTIENENENRRKETKNNENGYSHVQLKGTKRRGSQEIENNPRNSEEALAKREAREQRHHRKESSATIPNQFFKQNYDPEKDVKIQEQKNGVEAEQKRKERAEKKKQNDHSAQDIGEHHRRKSSFAFRELFGNDDNDNDDDDNNNIDPKSREKAKKEERRKSRQLLFKHVGDKGHLSDEDAQIQLNDKSQRYDFNNARKKSKGKENNRDKSKNPENNAQSGNKISQQNGTSVTKKSEKKKLHKRYDSSIAAEEDLGFEDPDVKLHLERLKIKDLQHELERKLDELYATQNKVSTMESDAQKVEKTLDALVEAKTSLAQKTATEITRLTVIINRLLRIPKVRDVVETVIQQSSTKTK